MLSIRSLFTTVTIGIIFLLFSCGKDSEDENLSPNSITIKNRSYSLNNGKYGSGFYSYMGLNCTNFYIECSEGAGITLEVDERLVGQTIHLEEGDLFWFFAIGNGTGTFVAFQNDRLPEGYSGWFRIGRDLSTNRCSLVFEINKKDELWAWGDIQALFERIPPP